MVLTRQIGGVLISAMHPSPLRQDTPLGLDDGFGAGSVLGPYLLVRQIGQGGMGEVYEAMHRGLEKRVAIKVLHMRFGDDPIARERFHREGRAAARVRHPNAVEVFDCGIERGIAWLAMEYLEGETLLDTIDREGVLATTRLVDLMLPVVAAVNAAHQQGIVHRDLKPGNIFLAQALHGIVQPKVLDFGVARVMGNDLGITCSTTLLGTPYYMSPEQTRSGRSATVHSDQYSLGVMLYEGATGSVPFEHDRLFDLMEAIVRAPVTAPRAIRPDLSPEFEALILRAMHRSPTRRFPSVRALGEALLPFASPALRALWEPVFDVATHHRTIVTYDAVSYDEPPATMSAPTMEDELPDPLPTRVMPAAVRAPAAPPTHLPALCESADDAVRLPMRATPRIVVWSAAAAAACLLVGALVFGLRSASAESSSARLDAQRDRAAVTAALVAAAPADPTPPAPAPSVLESHHTTPAQPDEAAPARGARRTRRAVTRRPARRESISFLR